MVEVQLQLVKEKLELAKIFNSKSNLPKIKDEAYLVNFDEFESVGTHWKASYVNANNIVMFDSLGLDILRK